MVLDASLLNTQQYKVRIKGKVEQSREKSSALPYTYRKGSLRVTLDYGRLLYLYIYRTLNTSKIWQKVNILGMSNRFKFIVFFLRDYTKVKGPSIL